MYGYCKSGHCGNVSVSLDARRFLTKEEKIEMLEEYKEALDKEAEGVSERISELKKEK